MALLHSFLIGFLSLFLASCSTSMDKTCHPCQEGLERKIPPPLMDFTTQPLPNDILEVEVYPVSTEMQIGKINTLIQRVPCGLYLTVGGERGFRAAAMSDKITALYMLDIHPDIILYNRINRELLKTPTRQQYLKLRWSSSFDEWQEALSQVALQSPLCSADFQWWMKNVRDLSRKGYVLPEHLNRLGTSPSCTDSKLSSSERRVDLGQILDYKAGNYLFYDDLYERIHHLALRGRIYTSQIDLMDPDQRQGLYSYVQGTGLTLSALDLDNLFFETYLGQEVYHKLISFLLPLGQPDSVLLVMNNYKNYACGQYQTYMGFTFENVRRWPQNFRMQDFTDSIPKEVHDLIDRRLYEGEEKLPVFQ